MNDLISRSALMAKLEGKAKANEMLGYMTAYDVTKECIEVVSEQPTVDAVPVVHACPIATYTEDEKTHGTWLYDTPEEAIDAWNTRKPMERIVEHLKRKKNPTLLLGPSWLSREERISQQKGYCKAFEEAIEIVKEEGGIE